MHRWITYTPWNNDKIQYEQKTLEYVWLQGQATDIQIQAEEIMRMKKALTGIYAKHTKYPYEELYNFMERDKFLTPDEAKKMGLIDSVLTHPPISAEEPK